MMRRRTKCPAEITLGVIGGRWKVLILYHLFQGVKRFSELQRSVNGVTLKVLTQQLREMERDRILHREVYAQVPPKVEYSLTGLGKSLKPVIDAMCEWGGSSLLNADSDLVSHPKLPHIPDPVDLFQGLHCGVVVLGDGKKRFSGTDTVHNRPLSFRGNGFLGDAYRGGLSMSSRWAGHPAWQVLSRHADRQPLARTDPGIHSQPVPLPKLALRHVVPCRNHSQRLSALHAVFDHCGSHV